MLVTIIPFSFAGLLRLARFCVLHHSSVLIGLLPSVNVVSFSFIKHVQMCNRSRTDESTYHQ